MKIITATGQIALDSAVQSIEGVSVIKQITDKKDLISECQKNEPDALLVTDGLIGTENLIALLLELKKIMPNLRIIYLAGEIDMRDEIKIQGLGMLVISGIHDIVIDRKISVPGLVAILENPKQFKDVEYLTKKFKLNGKTKKENLIEVELNDNEEVSSAYSNVYSFASCKPGTGKTFLSVNVATAIATYGKPKEDGKMPRVALIDADLQNLSVGTILHVEDEKRNLKTVMEKIEKIFDQNEELIEDIREIEKVNDFILKSFKSYEEYKNLECLTGSQLKIEEVSHMKAIYFEYLIQVISDKYDVIIFDTNSSFTHVTTAVLLQLSKQNFYVMNLDFNNIRNNVRYLNVLESLGVSDRVKYILNEDAEDDENVKEKLLFSTKNLEETQFNFVGKIPVIPNEVFLNRAFSGTPLVLDQGVAHTKDAKNEILKIANLIYPIKGIESEVKLKKKKGLFSGFFSKKVNKKKQG